MVGGMGSFHVARNGLALMSEMKWSERLPNGHKWCGKLMARNGKAGFESRKVQTAGRIFFLCIMRMSRFGVVLILRRAVSLSQ